MVWAWAWGLQGLGPRFVRSGISVLGFPKLEVWTKHSTQNDRNRNGANYLYICLYIYIYADSPIHLS